jgi:hypothetical protein
MKNSCEADLSEVCIFNYDDNDNNYDDNDYNNNNDNINAYLLIIYIGYSSPGSC